jgi:DNA-binding NarL/FixJ family response regulator
LELNTDDKPIRVLLVEDHSMVRAGLMLLLEKSEGVEVVAEAGDGIKALALASRHQPDVVLMDITLPGIDGLETTRRIIQEHPRTRVLMLSMHSSQEFVAKALSFGAAGYLLKESAAAELEVALRAVVRGENYLSPAVSGHILQEYLKHSQDVASPLDVLTPRQREVFDLIVEGLNTKAIASSLGVSIKTVETHRQQLMQRLQIHDIAGLTRLAISCSALPAKE